MDNLTEEAEIKELLRRLNMQIIAPTLLSDAEKTIRALVDRLKAADEVMKLAAIYQQTEKAYDWDVMNEALAKYNGEK